MEFGTRICRDEEKDDEFEDSGGPLGKDGPADPNKDDWTAQTSGAGGAQCKLHLGKGSPADPNKDDWTAQTSGARGAQRKLRPRLWNCVTPSGACTW
ncbi:hypothetical protein NDU88_006002 [Pleurodeles waltl]|uniref:Uncharacterized protein n=1 Tax=Pleurodeles waltl TaxID=8319 RepID=A0AAV7TX11_PLEWA|nr:hypothetical protein NDU88_006002 [Pleurodeles waltl]